MQQKIGLLTNSTTRWQKTKKVPVRGKGGEKSLGLLYEELQAQIKLMEISAC